ncbi:DUF1615 domain-containing protein, partial [Cronobacter sakazakii]
MAATFALPTRFRLLTLTALLTLAGCTSQTTTTEKGAKPLDVRAVVKQKMPASVKDRDGWARDIARAFETQKIPATEENICSVLAVAEQESNYQADPQVPGLGKIAWKEIERRAG